MIELFLIQKAVSLLHTRRDDTFAYFSGYLATSLLRIITSPVSGKVSREASSSGRERYKNNVSQATHPK